MATLQSIVYYLSFIAIFLLVIVHNSFSIHDLEGKVVKGNRNAVYLIKNKKKHFFPDFYTFSHMGFNASSILKISDSVLEEYPLGDPVAAIPVFRPEDYMYHAQCEDPHRMVNDLGVVANLGDLNRFAPVYKRISSKNSMEILFLGGSITAGGYFMEFVRLLKDEDHLNVTFHNHGHGATELSYTIFCVDIDKYRPDMVIIDFAVNDYGHPKLMDTLIRKALSLPSKPVVALANLWVAKECPVTRYLLHGYYYRIPILNVCPAVNLCYGKGHLPKHISDEYSKTDGVHPWGNQGVRFLGGLMYAWYKRIEFMLTKDNYMDLDGKMVSTTHSFDTKLDELVMDKLPPPLYVDNPIGLCTRCATLTDDSDGKLVPVGTPKGFRMISRVKVGFGGFSSDTSGATKSVKKSWHANSVGAEITFPFYGSTVKIIMWQRRDEMAVLHAFVDGNEKNIAKASGFFKGYSWAMERNNTGRSEVVTLFEGLSDAAHTLTIRVSDTPANKWVPGHVAQIFAVLSASDDLNCKTKLV